VYSWPVDLTPDGRSTLLNVISPCAGGVEAPLAAYLRTVDGAPAVRVGEGMSEAVSPDGRLVLAAGPRAVRVVPIGAGSPRTLALGFEIPMSVSGTVRVLPSGHEIVVTATETEGRVRLHVIGVEDGRTRQSSVPFSPNDSIQNWLSPVSPDARLVAARVLGGGVLLVPLDGTPPRKLPGSEPNDVPVQWSPDGQTLFVFHPGERSAPVFRVDVTSGRRTLWREIHPPDTTATGIDALFLSRDGRTGVYSFASARADLYLVDGLR
jgi:eukaryotic-like serine/threonine-protein kinase